MPTEAREIVASGARTASGNSGRQQIPSAGGDRLVLAVDVTAVGGTDPNLALSVEWSTDNGTTWFAAEPADAFTAITAATKKVKDFTIKGTHYRVVWTITGTLTPSVTFAIDEVVPDLA